LLTGAFCLAGAILRLGMIADFLSEPILLGYLAGTGLVAIASQTTKLLGLSLQGATTAPGARPVLTHLDQAHRVTALLAGLCFLGYILLKRYLPAIPSSLVIALAAIALSTLADLPHHGVAMVGPIATDLPTLALPGVNAQEVGALLPVAAGMALIAFTETAVAFRRAGRGRRGRGLYGPSGAG
jgi:sulfate permease, SulP family